MSNDQDKPDLASASLIREALQARFGESPQVDDRLPGLDQLARMASRRVLRRFTDRAVDPALLQLLCACALAAGCCALPFMALKKNKI